MSDSTVTTYDANMTGAPNCNPPNVAGAAPLSASFSPDAAFAATASSPTTTTTIFSVWDGDWAILEEYGPGNAVSEKYVQGLHGLVKTLVANVYYYQDELGSTSHVANSSGALLAVRYSKATVTICTANQRIGMLSTLNSQLPTTL